jgi:Tfp pilus assembly protein PilN
MEQINLLDSDVEAKGNLVGLSSKLKIALGVAFAVLIVLTLVVGVIMFINNQRLNTTLANQTQLKSSIEQLNATEQSYYLTKDRAQRAGEVLALGDSEEDIDYISDYLESKREDVDIKALSIRKGGLEFDSSIASISSVFNLLNSFQDQTFYDNVMIDGLTFNPNSGYLISFDVSRQQ